MHPIKRLHLFWCVLAIGLAGCAPASTATPAPQPTTEVVEVTPPPEGTVVVATSAPDIEVVRPEVVDDKYGLIYDSDNLLEDDGIGIAYLDRMDITVTADLRDAACTRFWPPDPPGFNAEAAAKENPRDQPILWTVIVNFEAWAEEEPLGCLRVYRRVEADQQFVEDGTTKSFPTTTFVEADGGGFVLNTCEVSDEVFDSRQGGSITKAMTDTVMCELNLFQWMRLLDQGDELVNPVPNTDPDFDAEVVSFTSNVSQTHAYSAFTLAALASVLDPTSEQTLPLVCYLKAGENDCAESLSLYMDAGSALNFPPPCFLTLDDIDRLDMSPDAAGPHFFWRQLFRPPTETPESEEPTPTPDPQNQFLYQAYEMADFTNPIPRPYARCIYEEQLPDPLVFPIGLAQLWIGSGADGSEFAGDIDGVVVDPTDSTPPGGGDE